MTTDALPLDCVRVKSRRARLAQAGWTHPFVLLPCACSCVSGLGFAVLFGAGHDLGWIVVGFGLALSVGLGLLFTTLWAFGLGCFRNEGPASSGHGAELPADGSAVTAPMRVDWLPPMHANGGQIGMSRAPGRKKGLEQRSLPADLADLHHNHGVNRIVTLLEQRELDAMECASMGPMALARHGIQWVHLAVRDKWIPTETSAFLETAVRAIVTAVIAGERVLVHCNGGKGRTGTAVAAALLVLGAVDGLGGAIQLMRAHRPGMLRNPLQQLYIWHLVPYLVWLRHTMAVCPLQRALPGAAVVSLV